MNAWICILHLVCTLLMLGVILFVQVVHYPLFAQVGAESFKRYEALHTVRTTWVVAPLMVGELLTALWLAVFPAAPALQWLTLLGLGLVVLIWASTALIQVPAHAALGEGFDLAVYQRLVRSNWLRTAAWALRAPIAVLLVAQ